MMAKVDQFLDSLVNYDKENINANILTALEVYLKDKGLGSSGKKSSTSSQILIPTSSDQSPGPRQASARG